jgi:outer membrane protein TolC
VAAAFARSAELAGLEATERAGRAAVEAAENAARSRLDLAVSGGPQATASGLGASLANTGKVTGYQVSASLTYDHALGEHAERGGEAVARATLAKARTELAAAKARTAGRVTRAAQRARAALASLTLCDRAIELATANIEAEQHRFELAKSTNFEVLRRQDELQTARLRRASAVVDYLSARAEVEGLTGELLGRYGVVIQ